MAVREYTAQTLRFSLPLYMKIHEMTENLQHRHLPGQFGYLIETAAVYVSEGIVIEKILEYGYVKF